MEMPKKNKTLLTFETYKNDKEWQVSDSSQQTLHAATWTTKVSESQSDPLDFGNFIWETTCFHSQ